MNSRAKFFVVFSSTSLVCLLLVGAVIGRSAPPDEPYKHLAVFTEVVHRIKSEYVEEPDMKSVALGAVNGLLEAIDPFASYLNAEQYKEYLKKKDTVKGETGLLLSKRSGFIAIVGVIPGTPAAQAGIGAGDFIETIKGVATRDMPLAYAEMMLKGDPGTSIEMTVFRSRKPEPQKISLNRVDLKIPAIESEMLPEQLGYIRPDTLAPGKVQEVAAAIGKLEAAGAKKIVLDLRGCAFGAPEAGAELANLFIESGTLTYSQGQKSPRQNIDAAAAKVKTKLPVQVVVNRGTANGCEVAAAALLDSKRGAVAGERTYGAASVRKVVALDDGSAVILSAAKFYSPSGKSIPDSGVMPTNLLQEPDAAEVEDDAATPDKPTTRVAPKDDPFLQRILSPAK